MIGRLLASTTCLSRKGRLLVRVYSADTTGELCVHPLHFVFSTSTKAMDSILKSFVYEPVGGLNLQLSGFEVDAPATAPSRQYGWQGDLVSGICFIAVRSQNENC